MIDSIPIFTRIFKMLVRPNDMVRKVFFLNVSIWSFLDAVDISTMLLYINTANFYHF